MAKDYSQIKSAFNGDINTTIRLDITISHIFKVRRRCLYCKRKRYIQFMQPSVTDRYSRISWQCPENDSDCLYHPESSF